MRRLLIAVAVAATAPAANAQSSLASRIAQAPDGIVRMQFDSRPGTCGDGRDMIGYGDALFARNFQSFGKWSAPKCVPGPLRVTLDVEDRQVTRVQTQAGGTWSSASGRVTDLGVVSSTEASAYFFSLVPRLESASGKDRLLLPAVLADDAVVLPSLTSLARDERRTSHLRGQAIQWIGMLGDASVVPLLTAFVRENATDDEGRKSSKKSLSGAALAALSQLDDDAGLPALIDFARNGSASVRHDAVFWLGQNAGPGAIRTLHAVIENEREEEKVRAHAIFSLAHGDAPASERAWLRSIFPRLDSDKLKESVLHGMSQDDDAGVTWLIERARDSRESMKIRRSALFWAGQREETRTSDILRVYRESKETAFREHAIFVLSQRQDEEATNALIAIAKDPADSKMGGKALFWLAQKKDPRVTKLISGLVLR